ncbi:Cleavage and polyadenylation specificity factor subunit 2 [Orchesella cincta]|uniref:Cleavage and polyadenylation specificity factor subunit 2 n=1 Tax=Orchesella cincta TaxID=48709 RepID=A0A1D2MX93_ORCCI|nr:Cleavage and polyadenylation specificity factor subunit 2 [Orchesella cincta]
MQVDEFRILLDCGWSEQCEESYLEELKNSQNGQMFLYDYYVSKSTTQDFDLYNLDDVDSAFDQVQQLKYNQSVSLSGKGYGLTLTPLPAGHMIGGTIWKIVKIGEEDIYYAVDFNHKKERHLNGCELDRIQRPSLFITDAYNANYIQTRRRERDEQLLANILHTLRSGGNVLIAVDTAGRVLELAHMLDQLWRSKDSGLSPYSLALVNNVAYNVLEFAKSQIEWMSEKLMRSFEGARSNPFQFKHLQICHTLAESARITSPKVVLASGQDLEFGHARDLFIQWCQDKKNCVILTNRPAQGTLAWQLIENPKPHSIELEVNQRIQLEERELEEFYRLQREKEYRVKKEKREAVIDSDDSDDSDSEIKITGIFRGNRVSHDLFIKPGMETKVDTGLFKSSRSRYPVYPMFEEKIRADEYGEFIRPEDFIITETNYDYDIEFKHEKKVNKGVLIADAEIPTKCTSFKQKLNFSCSVIFIDFEGRSDGESLQKLLEQMKPRRLIITRGSPDCVEALADSCTRLSPETIIYRPKLGEVVDATTESHIYQVRLKDALVSSLDLRRGRDAELAWIEGDLMMDDPTSENISRNILIPSLQPLDAMEISEHSTVFVNEIKLSDFKQVLAKHGIASEFSGGVLCAPMELWHYEDKKLEG